MSGDQEILRSLVDEIILTPGDAEMLVDVSGNLAGLLVISLKRKKPPQGRVNCNLSWLREGTIKGVSMACSKQRLDDPIQSGGCKQTNNDMLMPVDFELRHRNIMSQIYRKSR